MAGLLAHAPDRLFDVHRRRREPNLNLDTASPFAARPPQTMQLFRQSEGPFDVDLPFDHALLPQRTGQPFLHRLDELLRPGAVDGAFSS